MKFKGLLKIDLLKPIKERISKSSVRRIIFPKDDFLLFNGFIAKNLKNDLDLYKILGLVIDILEFNKSKRIVRKLQEEIKNGKSLSESLNKYKKSFNKLYINMIKFGEEHNCLIQILGASKYFSYHFQLTREPFGYLVVLYFFYILIFNGIFSYMIPVFTNFYHSGGVESINAITDFFLNNYGLFAVYYRILGLFIIFILIYKYFFKSPFPGMKKTLQYLFNFKLSTYIYIGIKNNISLPLIMSSFYEEDEVTPNKKEEINEMILSLKEGEPLNEALGKIKSLENYPISLLLLSKTSHDKTLIFNKLAKYYNNKLETHNQRVNLFTNLVFYLFLGFNVMFFCLSALIPILKLSGVMFEW